MKMIARNFTGALLACGLFLGIGMTVLAQDTAVPTLPIYNPGKLKPRDSKLKVKVGDQAPDFRLRTISGHEISRAVPLHWA